MHGEAIIEAAPAKINLALHVVGQRADGYHWMETLVAFTDYGDRLTVQPSTDDRFTLSGRFAGPLLSEPDAGNLVIRARDGLRALLTETGHTAAPVTINLEKNLPIASGIGGGSSDAAACLRALLRLWHVGSHHAGLDALLLRLGADIPMCFAARPLLATGIGETLTPLDTLPALPLVLVNPLLPVSTPEIFRRLTVKDNPPLPRPLPKGAAWLSYLIATRNDLEPPARAIVGEISEALGLLEEAGAAVSRMSGSGATVYGLFADRRAAEDACHRLRAARPDWFIEATMTGGCDDTP